MKSTLEKLQLNVIYLYSIDSTPNRFIMNRLAKGYIFPVPVQYPHHPPQDTATYVGGQCGDLSLLTDLLVTFQFDRIPFFSNCFTSVHIFNNDPPFSLFFFFSFLLFLFQDES